MDHLEEAAGGALAQMDRFCAGVRQILAEEVPVGAKTEKLRDFRETVLSEIEMLLGTFEEMAHRKEKDLMEQVARLRQLRDHVTVIRHGVLPMFTNPPRTDELGPPSRP